MDKTLVVIGSSQDKDYSFLLPITCMLWNDVIGLFPVPLLVGTQDEWVVDPCLSLVYRAIMTRGGMHPQFIGRAEGYPDHTTAQNCRQHAAALDIPDDTWIMPADADLWPLKRDFYHQHEGTQYRAVSLYANGDHFQGKENVLERSAQGLGTQTLPTCHLTMRAKDWRAIYNPIPGDIAGSIKKTLDAWLPTRVDVPGYDKGFHLWMSDQQLMTVALCKQPWFPGGVKFVGRRGHPPVDRLDRCHINDWAMPFDPTRWTDAHVHKSPYLPGMWSTLLKVIDGMMPQHSEWARKYHADYTKALEEVEHAAPVE